MFSASRIRLDETIDVIRAAVDVVEELRGAEHARAVRDGEAEEGSRREFTPKRSPTRLGVWADALQYLHVGGAAVGGEALSGDRAQPAAARAPISQLSVVGPPDIPAKGRSV
jgi:hypothetical protein